MREQLEKRLQALESEYVKGRQKLHELDAQRSGVAETLLRIDGAIQVLREELAAGERVSVQDAEIGIDSDEQSLSNHINIAAAGGERSLIH